MIRWWTTWTCITTTCGIYRGPVNGNMLGRKCHCTQLPTQQGAQLVKLGQGQREQTQHGPGCTEGRHLMVMNATWGAWQAGFIASDYRCFNKLPSARSQAGSCSASFNTWAGNISLRRAAASHSQCRWKNNEAVHKTYNSWCAWAAPMRREGCSWWLFHVWRLSTGLSLGAVDYLSPVAVDTSSACTINKHLFLENIGHYYLINHDQPSIFTNHFQPLWTIHCPVFAFLDPQRSTSIVTMFNY